MLHGKVQDYIQNAKHKHKRDGYTEKKSRSLNVLRLLFFNILVCDQLALHIAKSLRIVTKKTAGILQF